jgi:ribulose-5-phosphate 4-epimerase/fuculose-1-phosphate aldolase
MKTESQLRDRLVEIGRSLHRRGLSPGSSGNISVRLGDGWLLTPTNSCLGELDPAALSQLDRDGNLISGDKPTKESFLHLAIYRSRPEAGAVIHLHSTYSAAVSCLDGLDPCSCIPPLTAYFVMKVGRLPLIPYCRPGDRTLGDQVAKVAVRHTAILLANHGPVVSGVDLDAAMYAVEELEETAKLMLILEGHRIRTLAPDQILDLRKTFRANWE